MARQNSAFTVKANGGRLRELITACRVAQPGVAAHHLSPQFADFKAIWDTGATNSLITQAVVDACNLQPTGMAEVHGVSGVNLCETYMVDFALPNNIIVQSVNVTKGVLGGGDQGDVLIGMDIITLGDFVITNKSGVTWFSFHTPSIRHVDYVGELKDQIQLDKLRAAQEANRKKVKKGKTFGRKK